MTFQTKNNLKPKLSQNKAIESSAHLFMNKGVFKNAKKKASITLNKFALYQTCASAFKVKTGYPNVGCTQHVVFAKTYRSLYLNQWERDAKFKMDQYQWGNVQTFTIAVICIFFSNIHDCSYLQLFLLLCIKFILAYFANRVHSSVNLTLLAVFLM